MNSRAVVLPLHLLAVFCNSWETDPENPPSAYVTMVPLTGGATRMGDLSSATGKANELPVHTVQLRSFMISSTEITQELYILVMGINPSFHTASPSSPVENVSWIDAVRLCNAMSVLEGLDACYSGIETDSVSCDLSRNGYRLPTEAEWEYACRAGTITRYASGQETESLDAMAWHLQNAGDEPHPVGGKDPNAYDIFDMHGNVTEWCSDWYDPTYYFRSPEENPTGPMRGSERVRRGGSYLAPLEALRSAHRGDAAAPALRAGESGFRVVRTMI